MSTTDLLSDKVMTDHSMAAWGAGVSELAARCEFGAAPEEEGSDLAGNAKQIMAGGTMSILRRKGKNAAKD